MNQVDLTHFVKTFFLRLDTRLVLHNCIAWSFSPGLSFSFNVAIWPLKTQTFLSLGHIDVPDFNLNSGVKPLIAKLKTKWTGEKCV